MKTQQDFKGAFNGHKDIWIEPFCGVRQEIL